jgi:hypothetical protein
VFAPQQGRDKEEMGNEILPCYNRKLNNEGRSMTMKKIYLGALMTVLSIPIATVDPIVEAIIKIF